MLIEVTRLQDWSVVFWYLLFGPDSVTEPKDHFGFSSFLFIYYPYFHP